MSVTLTVYGAVAPKGSRTLGRRRDGSTFTRPASNAEHRWVQAVADQAMWVRSQLEELPAAPYAVSLRFYFARPQRPAHEHPSRIDVDKCARAVLDGLARGGLIEDDRHVTELTATKNWAETPDGECCQIAVASAVPVAA